jgi:hypothetical protein
MARIEFRLFLENEPATREQLDAVEEITVEQRVDAAWEARATYPLRVDAKGRWIGADEPWMRPFARYRVEIRIAGGAWVPLIDGPVVQRRTPSNPEPGRSTLTLVVHDDSVLLNREHGSETLEGTLTEVVERLFEHEAIAGTDVEEPETGGGDGATPYTQRRGSNMQLLRQLARQADMHAYVLPGDRPGESVGCFKAYPTGPGDLSALYLLGPERNLEEFDVSGDHQGPARAQASMLSFVDKSITTAQTGPDDLQLLGDEPAPAGAREASLLAPPAYGGVTDPTTRATAAARRASRATEARGSVRTSAYGGVLRPYEAVKVGGVKDTDCGTYVVQSVTHTLTRSEYTQHFTLVRDAVSAPAGSGPPVPGGIF